MKPTLFGRPVTRLHCIGVGGMGVGPLAIYLADLGFVVTGEDDALTDEMHAQLRRAGVQVGPMPPDCDLVVCSSAIAASHPAAVAAAARRLPVVRRGELLAEVTRTRKLVAVCGSHGKTTTTAMLITALRAAGFPAGYVLGGLFADDTPPAAAGRNDWIVAEIDESDGTIDRFAPELTVAVNLDWDHPDYYRTREAIEAAFAALFMRTRTAVLVHADCAMSARVVGACQPAPATQATGPAFATFGEHGDFGAHVKEAAPGQLTLALHGRFSPVEATVKAAGAFNAANATAALAAASLMGASLRPELLAAYPAVRRRQTVLAEAAIKVVEDYAHHPREIRALVDSLRRQVSPGGRLLIVFQPHRFSRTVQFKTDFAHALASGDAVYLMDVYAAGESVLAGGSTADLVAELHRLAPDRKVTYAPEVDRVLTGLLHDVRPGDLVAFVGAGDIDKAARRWVARWTTREQRPPGSSPTEEGRRATGRTHQADWDAFVTEVSPRLGATLVKREEPLAKKTTMRIGGAARLYAEPAELADLQILLREAKARVLPVYVLGRGSNLLVPDEGVDGLVISLAHECWATFEPRPDGRVWVGAGLRLKNLCGLAAKAGLVGFEFLEGIPASVGGALRMNAGAMGGWMFDVVEEVRLITLDGEVRTLPKAAMHVDYRHCEELHHAIALGALLRPAANADADSIRRQMDAYARKRHESQPREPSAGCIFKNPPGTSAGRLIDECGLKGTRVGDAEVSTVHANFIVNRGNATSADVLELVRRIRARVRELKGVELQPEVLLYGQRWEDVL